MTTSEAHPALSDTPGDGLPMMPAAERREINLARDGLDDPAPLVDKRRPTHPVLGTGESPEAIARPSSASSTIGATTVDRQPSRSGSLAYGPREQVPDSEIGDVTLGASAERVTRGRRHVAQGGSDAPVTETIAGGHRCPARCPTSSPTSASEDEEMKQ